jgi:large subunit ribosomal protein L28
MSQICDVCGKAPSFGNNVSHSHRKTPRAWYPNLQKVHAMVEGTCKTVRVCTKCLKAGKVTRCQ